FRNTGSHPWTREYPYPELRSFRYLTPSAYYHSTWVGEQRIGHLVEGHVPPGKVGRIRFRVAPAPSAKPERFQLFLFSGPHNLDEGYWLPNTQFDFPPLAQR